MDTMNNKGSSSLRPGQVPKSSSKMSSIMKMSAVLALLALGHEGVAQAKKPPQTRSVQKRSVSTKDSVGVPKQTGNTVQLSVGDTINNPLAHYGYPFTLSIFDVNDMTFTPEKLSELKQFIDVDLKDKSKRRQIAVNFLRGDRESRKELFLKKIENIVGYNLLKLEGDDTLRIANQVYELYETYYVPLVSNSAIGGRNSVLTKDQLIASVENNFNAEVVSNAIKFIKNNRIPVATRMEKVDDFFDVLGKYYNRRKYLSEAADPKAPIKNKDERDALEFTNLLMQDKALSTEISGEDRTQGFNLNDKTIDENIHILDIIIASGDIVGVSQVLEKILVSKKSQEFTIKYRLFKLVKQLPTQLKRALTKEDKMKVIYSFSKRIEYATDLSDITIGGKSVKDSAKAIFNNEYADEVYGDLDSKEMREIENLTRDFDQTGQPFDLESNELDGMTQAEIDDNIRDAIDRDNTLYEMYRYMEHLTKVKVINADNASIIEHFSRKDRKGQFIYTNDKAHFNSLVYVTPELFMRLVDNINANPHIKEVRFNLHLMRKAFDATNYNRIVRSLGNLRKHIILDTEGENPGDLQGFVAMRQQFARGYSVTYNANRLSEDEANLLFALPGPLHIPRCKAFPWNTNEAFEKALAQWKSLNPGGSLDMGFLAMGKNAYRSLAKVFADNQAYVIYLNGIESLQKEEQEWLNKANVSISTSALSYPKLGREAKYAFNFGRPPQTDGFFTTEQVTGKKQKYTTYNSRSLAGFNAISEEDMEYAQQNYFGPMLEVGEGNTESYHLSAYNAMQNLVWLKLYTSTWDKSKTDTLAKGKIRQITLYGYQSTDEETVGSLVTTMNTTYLPDLQQIPLSEYNSQTNERTNPTVAALCKSSNNIYLSSIKQIDMGWAIEMRKKTGGVISLTGDVEGRPGVQSILLKDKKGNDVVVNADNSHEYKELLVPFFAQCFKSKATIEFSPRIQRLFNNYISLKKKK